MSIVSLWQAGFRGYLMVGPFEKLQEAQSSARLNNSVLLHMAYQDGGQVLEAYPGKEEGDDRGLFASSRFIYGEYRGILWRLPRCE